MVVVAVGCMKTMESFENVPIEFNVDRADLTKASIVDASTLASSGFHANATTGTVGAESEVWSNALFTLSDGKYRSVGKVWPEGGNPGYHFYASNASLTYTSSGPTVSVSSTMDVVCAVNDSPAYKSANGLAFYHIFGRIGSVVVSAEDGFTISGISIKLTPVTGGTYSLREGAGHTDRTGWSGLVTGSATTIATAVGGNPNDLYVVPGTYTLTATWTASKNGTTHTFTDKTVDVAVSAGMHNTITLTLGGGNLKYAAKFSVSATKQVEFAEGNLQATYNGSSWTWKFADHQWDYVGNAAGNTSVTATSPFISSNATVDLFGWVGASSTWTGVNQYGITSSTATDAVDGYGNVATESLKADWGSIPGIVSAYGDGWYTLSSTEWKYVIRDRTSGATVNGTPNARYTYAAINTDGIGVNGVILFPDGVTIASGEVTAWGAINNYSDWETKCTTAQWSTLESMGCVFLPAAGCRYGASVDDVGSFGRYWSSTPISRNVVGDAYCVYFSYSGGMSPRANSNRYCGFSVRLARDVN